MNSTESPQQTALHAWHCDHEGRMVDFAGWSMPVQYGSIIDEHQATRASVGMFDVSHMGRLHFPDVAKSIDALNALTTRRIDSMKDGQIRYSLITNTAGGILDDVLVYRAPDLAGNTQLMMVVNASNRSKIVDWLNEHWPAGVSKPEDRTLTTAMIAVQGPLANQIVANHSDIDPSALKYYTGASGMVCGHEALVTRTGYTGEDGCELIVDAQFAEEIWATLHGAAEKKQGSACGLASRDTLRLEAAMPLYGHELNETINAAQTGLTFAINLKGRSFPGRDQIAAATTEQNLPVRIGLVLEGKRAAREGCEIFIDDAAVGHITSGTFSPTLQQSISMGYIDPRFCQSGTELSIDIRGKRHVGRVAKLPFYTRPAV